MREHLEGAAAHFTRARILREQGIELEGPDPYPTSGEHPMAGVHKLAETMHGHGFRQMKEVFNEVASAHMDRRRLSDSWGDIFGMKTLEFMFYVDYEQAYANPSSCVRAKVWRLRKPCLRKEPPV